MRTRVAAITAMVLAVASFVPTATYSHPDDAKAAHPAPAGEGHLPPSSRNVELVGSIHLTNLPWGVSDVAARGNYAYVGSFASECAVNDRGGVHIVDITLPMLPRKVGFVHAGANTFVGEGVQVLPISTPKFRGDVLVVSNEPCGFGRASNGGMSMWDVTDPANPKVLTLGFGDRDPRPPGLMSAHPSHSVMAWDAGSKAYAVLVGADAYDVDIVDITDPRRPKLITETGLSKFRRAVTWQSGGLGTFPASFHHDMLVKKIDGHWFLLLSYWDTGWVMLNVDNPRRPRYVRSSEYPLKDPLTKKQPEGNAHQAVWTPDNRYIVGGGEDFAAKRTSFTATRGTKVRNVRGHELFWGRPVSALGTLNGKTIYGGVGCAPLDVPPATTLGRRARGEEAIVVLSEGGCSFADKVRAAQTAGYQAVVLATSHQSTTFGQSPSRIACHESSGGFRPRASVLCITHEEMHTLFRKSPQHIDPISDEPEVGARGDRITVSTQFDGAWGDVRLLDARTMKELDVYAIPQARKSGYGTGYGILSVHELEADTRRSVPLVYAAWYSGGLRVLKAKSGSLTEVGHYVDGNTFWGVHVLPQPGERPLLLMSDVNHGLFIYRYTGPE